MECLLHGEGREWGRVNNAGLVEVPEVGTDSPFFTRPRNLLFRDNKEPSILTAPLVISWDDGPIVQPFFNLFFYNFSYIR